MHSEEIAVSVRNLSKKYRIFGHPGERLKQAMTFGLKHYHREFTALRDISFDIKRGETIGIIGRNGSGKSTLLQLVCGILKPTSGYARAYGRIAALLELGAGFNPEFTGRENVYFQGALMGINAEAMDERFPDIAEFAEIGDFIDQPVRTYSSGMYVRLAFSVAIHIQPDILVVDEALSVGDVAFQHKSRKRVQELINTGTSLLLVSHDRSMITSTCGRCILLDNGRIIKDGAPSDVFDYYHALIAKGSEQIQLNRLDSGRSQIISGTGEARMQGIRLLDKEGKELRTLEVGMPVVFEFRVRAFQPIPRLVFAFAIRDRSGQTIFNTNTNCFGKTPENVQANAELIFRFCMHANMGPGSYSISSFLTSTNDRFVNNYESCELAGFFELLNETHPYFLGSAWLQPELSVETY
jgi:lipopolysaccharide transport system ATP-binding protein